VLSDYAELGTIRGPYKGRPGDPSYFSHLASFRARGPKTTPNGCSSSSSPSGGGTPRSVHFQWGCASLDKKERWISIGVSFPNKDLIERFTAWRETMSQTGVAMPQGQCKLCLKDKNLQDSHLLPSSLYKMGRDPERNPPDPIVITSEISHHTSKQVRDYLLCRDCEQLFNKNGEHWVMQQVYNGKRFPLFDRLKLALHVYASPTLPAYSGTAVGIDTGKLAYFALSVLWRASVHKWVMDGQTISISLGVYEEVIRKFLFGETAFPLDVIVITTVCTDALSRESSYVPCLVPENSFTAYAFLTRGINFRVLVGNNLTSQIRELCCVTGAKKLIFVTSCEDKSFNAFAHLMPTSKPSRRLRI
jgi:hypothetical protein